MVSSDKVQNIENYDINRKYFIDEKILKFMAGLNELDFFVQGYEVSVV